MTNTRTSALSRHTRPAELALRIMLAFVLACGFVAVPPSAHADPSEPIPDEGSLVEQPAGNAEKPSAPPEPLSPPEAPADPAAPVPDQNDDSDTSETPDTAATAPNAATTSLDTPEVRGPADWALDKVYGIAFGLAEGAAFKALEAAVDPDDAEELDKVLDFVDGLLGGSSGIEHECENILKAVNEMSRQLADLENSIDRQFNELEQTILLEQIENERAQIVKMSDSVYAPALAAYNEFIEAAQAYSESTGTTNEQARREAVAVKEQALVNAFDKLDYEGDLTAIETVGINMGNYTYHRYLYNLDKYADEALAFDHQRYTLLTAGINDVVANLNIIAYVQRLEYDYWKSKVENEKEGKKDPSIDPTKVPLLENSLKTNLNRIARDINYTVSEFANKDGLDTWQRTDLLTLMRPYDFQTEYDFNYESSSNRTFKYRTPDINGKATSTMHYTAVAVKTAPTMAVYRASVKGSTYLVVDGSRGISHGEKHGDLIHGLRYWEKMRYDKFFTHDYFGLPDQDFFNLLSTSDGVYSLPKDFAPLAPLVKQGSYAGSGGSLTSFLRSNGMTSLGQAPYVLMNSYVDPAPHSGVRAQNHYSSFNLYSTAIPSNGNYDSAKVKLTMEDSAGDPGMLVVLAQEPDKREAYQLFANPEGSGLDIAMTDLEGNALPDKVPAGTRVRIAVTASEPTALDSLVLKDEAGDVLETLATPEAASLAERDAASGALVFTFAMPYQDAFIVASPGVAPPNPLHFSEDADGAYLVSTLDDLVKVAAAYEQHAGAYERATFRLAADIVNLRMPFPAWTTPIGTEAHPFTGTFDGAGHRIGGFTMDMTNGPLASQKYGGIFGVIDEGGAVHDVAVSAVDFNGNPAAQSVGALAGLNRGAIADCSTGSAQTGFAPSSSWLASDEVALMNATVSGLDAGGLVAVNRGQVLNSWSGADVRASSSGHGGGLVGVSESGSSVWNGYALGNVYSGGQVGGLIGRNYGDVHNAYYAGTEVNGSQAGGFIGANHHDVFAGYVVEDAAARAFGSGYAGDDPEASLTKLARDSMAAQTFADQLNEQVTGTMNWWTRTDETNAGYPYQVKDPMIERTIVDEATGVELSGTIHAGAVLSIEPIAEGDESLSALLRHAEEADLLGELAASYRALLPVSGRKSGQTTLGGPVELRVPVPEAFHGRDVTVLQEHPDGMVALDAAIADGVVTVQVSAVSPFAVIVDDASEPAEPTVPAGKKLAPTGDSAGGAAALTTLLFAAALAIALSHGRLRRRLPKKEG